MRLTDTQSPSPWIKLPTSTSLAEQQRAVGSSVPISPVPAGTSMAQELPHGEEQTSPLPFPKPPAHLPLTHRQLWTAITGIVSFQHAQHVRQQKRADVGAKGAQLLQERKAQGAENTPLTRHLFLQHKSQITPSMEKGCPKHFLSAQTQLMCSPWGNSHNSHNSPLLPRAPWHGHPLCSPNPQCWQGGASLSPGRSPFEESAKMGSLSRGRSQSWGGHRSYAKACVNQGFVSPKFQSPPSQECLSMTAGQLSAPDTELCHCHPSEHPPNRSANPILSKYIKIKGGRQRKGTGCAHKAFVNNNPVKGSSELHDVQCQPVWGSCNTLSFEPSWDLQSSCTVPYISFQVLFSPLVPLLLCLPELPEMQMTNECFPQLIFWQLVVLEADLKTAGIEIGKNKQEKQCDFLPVPCHWLMYSWGRSHKNQETFSPSVKSKN